MKKFDFKKWYPAVEKALPVIKQYRAALIILFAGIILLASGGGFSAAKTEKEQLTTIETSQDGFNLAEFQQTLSQNLSSIKGVGRVSLMLSIEETEEAVYAVDIRRSTNGENAQNYESNLTILSDGSYGEKPVTVKNMQPIFRGAVVLCDGADNAKVQLAVTSAVSTVCGIGTDKVTVLKMEEPS